MKESFLQLNRKMNGKPVNMGLWVDIRRVGMPQRMEKIYPLFVVGEEEKASKVVLNENKSSH